MGSSESVTSILMEWQFNQSVIRTLHKVTTPGMMGGGGTQDEGRASRTIQCANKATLILTCQFTSGSGQSYFCVELIVSVCDTCIIIASWNQHTDVWNLISSLSCTKVWPYSG